MVTVLVIFLLFIIAILTIVLIAILTWNRWKKSRNEQFRLLQELEAEALAAEQTGPMDLPRSSQTRIPGQKLPGGLILNFDDSEDEQSLTSLSNPRGLRQNIILQPFIDYIDHPLAWLKQYQDKTGERYDLCNFTVGSVLAIIEWRYGGLFRGNKVFAQFGNRRYTFAEKLFSGVEIRDADTGKTLATLQRNAYEIKFFNGQVVQWQISNPLERPCRFVTQNNTELLAYSGSIGNIRIKSTNQDIVPILALLIIYEYKKVQEP